MKKILVNGKEYQYIKLLGKGQSGETWLATDGSTDFAIKKIISDNEADRKEQLEKSLSDYHRISEAGIPVSRLIEIDCSAGLILKEYIPGDRALNYLLKKQKMDEITKQLRETYQKGKQAGIVLDYSFTNFIVYKDQLVYIDYACTDMENVNMDCFEEQMLSLWNPDTPEFAKMLYRIMLTTAEGE